MLHTQLPDKGIQSLVFLPSVTELVVQIKCSWGNKWHPQKRMTETLMKDCLWWGLSEINRMGKLLEKPS